MALRSLFLSAALLIAGEVAARPAACILPTWTLDGIKISFKNPASANFTLVNTVTNIPEAVSCRLEFATLCEIKGTPSNKDLYIHLQTKGEDVWVNVTSPYTCDGR